MVEKRYAGQNKTQRDLNTLIDEVAALDHGALSGLADDDHPQYAKADDLTAHADASNGVHGLPTGTYPLGITSGAGYWGQSGAVLALVEQGGSLGNRSAAEGLSKSFAVAFSATPIVLTGGGARAVVCPYHITSTGFAYMIFAYNAGTHSMQFLAIGT